MNDNELVATESESKGTVSFSVRLTDKQRDLLVQAAEAKGWTVTNLLKNAALEKAAFIVNTATPNRVDFPRVARQIADHLFRERQARVAEMGGALVDAVVVETFSGDLDMPFVEVEVSPWKMPSDFAEEIRDAARYGGTEFLKLIVDESETIASRSEPKNLRDPIDPSAL